jgi:hypothetical protein
VDFEREIISPLANPSPNPLQEGDSGSDGILSPFGGVEKSLKDSIIRVYSVVDIKAFSFNLTTATLRISQ